MTSYTLLVNGSQRQVQSDPTKPLLWILREDLGLTGTKFGCGAAQCGCCTVHLDGKAIRSCVTTVASAAGHHITTIEGLRAQPLGRAVEAAWLEEDVAQCGYCQPGQMMQATALLQKTPNPSDEVIDREMAGNLCRCATYVRIRRAVHRVASNK